MFSKQYRLPLSSFPQTTVSFVCPFFILRLQPNTLSYNRYGFIVSKRVDKKATMRNHTKRKLRAIVENMHPQLLQGYDLLFIIRKPLRNDSPAVEASMQEIWREAKLV